MAPAVPRRVGSVVLAVIFVLAGVQSLVEATPTLLGLENTPMLLGVWHVLVGIAALAAGHGAWHRSAWGPWAAVAYGALSGTMVASLRVILDLPDEAQAGLLASGVVMLAIGLALAKWMQVLRRPTTPS